MSRTAARTLAFEIGTEELPAFDLARVTGQLGGLAAAAFDGARIPHGEIEVYTTPRRLIIAAHGIPEATEELAEEYKGPSVALAFDAAGAPTKAALGFARGKGVAPESLVRREVGGCEYVFAAKTLPSRPVEGMLPEVLEGLIEAVPWPKSCRWGTQGVYFSRPVRWLLALFGTAVVPVRFAGLVAGNTTRGHRFLSPGPFEVASADGLIPAITAAFVVPSQGAREKIIRAGVARIEGETGCRADLPQKTLTEVVNLAEYPSVWAGTFDEGFLKVPEEIIVDALLVHQRYFPLYDGQGKLTNRFIIVSNGDPACADAIIHGNERVVRPRLFDARFFFEEDLKQPLDAFVSRLDEVVFQDSLGTMKDKALRIVALASHLAADGGFSASDVADAERAAYLCKADLVSNAVVEFTSVQGVMGAYYAQAAGENGQVVQAIAEHYRPRFSGDALPNTWVGQAVALADKLDTVCGLFALGQAPSGSSDPFALRRSAIGIINMLASGLPVSLTRAIQASLSTFAAVGFDCAKVTEEVIGFFTTRTRVMLRDEGYAPGVIDAVLAVGVDEPADVIARTRALEAARKDMAGVMDDLAVAYARANNLRDPHLGTGIDEALMGAAEHALAQAVGEVEGRVDAALERDGYADALRELAQLRSPIDRFFTDVLVMDEDGATRNNRLRLLNRFVAAFSRVADFGKMAKGQ